MKRLIYLLTILYIPNTLCTIDLSKQEYVYLSHHLTLEECRSLYGSLHFTHYELPRTLAKAVAKVPKGRPCIDLLLEWDKCKLKWGGSGKSHDVVERRLRQLGRQDLADWLDREVFEKLAQNAEEGLLTPFHNKTTTIKSKKYVYKKMPGQEWTAFDSVLWLLSGTLFSMVVFVFLRVIYICIKARCLRRKEQQEDIMDLLNRSIDSDQETIYECVLNRNVPRDVANDDR